MMRSKARWGLLLHCCTFRVVSSLHPFLDAFWSRPYRYVLRVELVEEVRLCLVELATWSPSSLSCFWSSELTDGLRVFVLVRHFAEARTQSLIRVRKGRAASPDGSSAAATCAATSQVKYTFQCHY